MHSCCANCPAAKKRLTAHITEHSNGAAGSTARRRPLLRQVGCPSAVTAGVLLIDPGAEHSAAAPAPAALPIGSRQASPQPHRQTPAAVARPADMEELVLLLQHCLSPEEAARRAAEARLGELNAQPGFAAALAQLGCSSDGGASAAVELRQMALSVLKGFVNSGAWLQGGVPPAEQAAVHALLLDALSDQTPRVRTAVGAVIGRLAKDEWPDRWPELMPALVAHVQSGAPARMAGALRCVQIFADDISDSQLPAALGALWPMLHQVLLCDTPGAYQRLRARAMAVVHSLLSMLRLRVGAGAPGSREQLARVLEPCLAVCLSILQAAASGGGADDVGGSAGYGVQIHTLRTVTLLFQGFPKSMGEALGTMLPALLTMLRGGLAAFEAARVCGAADAAEAAYDSDGTPLGFEDCVAQLLELIGSLVEAPRLRKALLCVRNRACATPLSIEHLALDTCVHHT
jgi:hypothetical protein